MRPRIATVVSARSWEASIAYEARTAGSARLVRRCTNPAEVDALLSSVDAILIGAETPWSTVDRIATWKARGTVVVGIHPEHDEPSIRRLLMAGADRVIPELTPSWDILAAIPQLIGMEPGPVEVSVVGAHDTVPFRRAVVSALGMLLGDRAMPYDAGEVSSVPLIGEPVLVCRGSVGGVLNAAKLTNDWFGPVPRLVLADLPRTPELREIVRRARREIGLEPAAVLPADGGPLHVRRRLRGLARSLVPAPCR